MGDTGKERLAEAVKRALASADEMLLANVDKVGGVARQTLERMKATGVASKDEATQLCRVLHKLGHHDRAAHIDDALSQ